MTQTNRRPNQAPVGNRRPVPGQPVRRQQSVHRAQPVRHTPPPRRRGIGMDMITLLIGGIVVSVLALLLQALWPNGFPVVEHAMDANAGAMQPVSEIYSPGPVRINEVMSSNRRTLVMENEASPDWIEVANIGASPVRLKGYTLSQKQDDTRVFTFPDIELQPGECILVYADSRLRETAGEALHAPYGLSAGGDTLMLFNAGGTAIDTVNIPVLSSDQSYVRMGTSAWEVSGQPTPGMENTPEAYQKLQAPIDNSPVIVTEIMSTNAGTYADENGQYSDYIELYNRSGESVNLGGWYLTDDPETLRKWRFPDVELAPGAYLVVHASKLDRSTDPAHLHTNFGLSSEGEEILLVDASGRIADRVRFDLLKADIAWSLLGDGSWSSASAPSPGKAN